jgi:hypothetical protein
MLSMIDKNVVLGASAAAVALSILAYSLVGPELGIFVGLWPPTFLLAGQYLIQEN